MKFQKGHFVPPEWRHAVMEAHRGRPLSLEHRRKISEAMKGESNPMKRPEVRAKYNMAIKDPNYCKKMGDLSRGRRHSMETRRKMSEIMHQPVIMARERETHQGDKNSNWRGGVSFEPYCPKFNKDLKERVRAYFGHRCLRCGKTEIEVGEKVHVHHVNYQKMACCTAPPIFATLCRSCHSWTNHHREEAEILLTSIINSDFGGRSYFSREELQVKV